MTAHPHHVFFAKKTLPSHVFEAPDQMFEVLGTLKRDAHLLNLWIEAGADLPVQLSSVGSTVLGPARLSVRGRIKRDGKEVFVLEMPPAANPNEAMFSALVRDSDGVSVVYYERCLNEAMDGVSDREMVLSQVRADQSRSNFGFKQGPDLDSFVGHLSALLGISLDGMEANLPAFPMPDDMFTGRRPGGQQGSKDHTAFPGWVGKVIAGLFAMGLALFAAIWLLGGLEVIRQMLDNVYGYTALGGIIGGIVGALSITLYHMWRFNWRR